MRVEFAGGHRIAVETEQVVRRESILNTVGSLVVILPLLYISFRSLWLMGVGALPAALSLLFVLGAFGFLGSRLSAAGTGASAMLFGLGIDGVVLLYVAYLRPQAETEAAGIASRISGPASSMLLGMWTTAATFYGLAFVDFPSLQQLGLLIGHSMAICGVVTLLLVPALLPRHAPRGPVRASSMAKLPQWIRSHRRTILVTAAALTCALGIASSGLRVRPKPRASAFGHRCGQARSDDRLGVWIADERVSRPGRGRGSERASRNERAYGSANHRGDSGRRCAGPDVVPALGRRSGTRRSTDRAVRADCHRRAPLPRTRGGAERLPAGGLRAVRRAAATTSSTPHSA